jgi:uncharacterized protein YqcC (DUF446 family)
MISNANRLKKLRHAITIPKKTKDFLNESELLSVIQTTQNHWQQTKPACRRFELPSRLCLDAISVSHWISRIGEACSITWISIDSVNDIILQLHLQQRWSIFT